LLQGEIMLEFIKEPKTSSRTILSTGFLNTQQKNQTKLFLLLTEIFIPLQYTERAMQLLNELYVKEGYSATSFYSTELYAGYKSKSWMNPAYEEGEYSNGTFRIDIFWYINNEGNPAGRDGYFKQFWDLFMNNKIPFRLHWGKFIPDYDYKEWANYYKSQFPRWDDFLDLRKERDPKNIFLTKYWKLRLLGEK